jgi:hypothetical protein
VRLPEGKVELCCNACKSTELPTPEASQKNLPLDNLSASDEKTENDSGGSHIPQAFAGPPIVANGLIPPPLEEFDAEESLAGLISFLEGLPSVNSMPFPGKDQNQASGSATPAMAPLTASVPLSIPSSTAPVVPAALEPPPVILSLKESAVVGVNQIITKKKGVRFNEAPPITINS